LTSGRYREDSDQAGSKRWQIDCNGDCSVWRENYCRRGSSEIKEIDDKLDTHSLPERQPSEIVPDIHCGILNGML
jgi:hypothetical protein